MDTYSAYKDSGEQWLGQIPAHWEIRKSKYVWREKNAVSYTGKEQLLSVSQYEGVRPSNESSRSESCKGYKIVEKDDLVINIMLAWLGGLGVSNYEGIVSPAYCIYKPLIDVNTKYLHYLYKTPMYLAEFARHSTGVVPSRWRMYTDDFGQVLTVLPPKEEQEAMVAYLDEQTAQIDNAIAREQKMIDLLEERKQIIIRDFAIRGLDPDVQTKPSGLSWLCDIPAHWEIKKFNRLITLLTDFTANGSFGDLARNIHYESEGYARLVRLTDLRHNLKNSEGVWVDKHGYDYLLKSRLYGGELLMANVGAYSGLPCVMPKVDYPTTLAPNMFLIKQDEGQMITRYLYYLLISREYFGWLQTIAVSSAQPKLNKDNIRTLPIIVPPIEEQKRIVNYIDKRVSEIDAAIAPHKKMIALLQERKQIIINEVVTGKIKVS